MVSNEEKIKFNVVKTELESLIQKMNLISVKEAAARRNTTRSAVLQLIARGRLNCEQILGRTFLYGDEIDGFVQNRPGRPAQTLPTSVTETA